MKSLYERLAIAASLTLCLLPAHSQAAEPRSKTITSVLQEPLPPEELSYSVASDRIIIEGPTYDYGVDGMYIDDNLAYANCTLWKEHRHPQKVYDCLIELHEMNWRRRQLLHERCPHDSST